MCKCNICGNNIYTEDNLELQHEFGYGSKKYDGDKLNLNVCNKCTDDFITSLISTCKISPLTPCDDYYSELAIAYREELLQ
jgi:hypothetical protein